MESNEWQQGHNHYWHGGAPCTYERGTIAHAEWWAGWEAAVAEDYQQSQLALEQARGGGAEARTEA